jgi:hypothetical protein
MQQKKRKNACIISLDNRLLPAKARLAAGKLGLIAIPLELTT